MIALALLAVTPAVWINDCMQISREKIKGMLRKRC